MILLTEPERRRLLSEIAAVALAVGRDLFPDADLNDLDIGESATANGEPSCPRERLGFLQSVWPRVAGAVASLEAAPSVALRAGYRETALVRARRVAPADLLAALRSGEFVPAPIGASPLAARLGGRLPKRVRERVALPSADTPANRMVKAILVAFSRDLAAITELAAVGGVPSVAREAARLRRRVRSALRRAPWRTLPLIPGPIPSLPPSARAHGAYRLIHDAWRRYRRGFAFDWGNALFTLPQRDAWLLYEYWCLLAVTDALRRLGYRAVQADGFALSRAGLTFTLIRGRASAIRFADPDRGRVVTLTYNRAFPRGRADASGWHTRSHAMRPDLLLETAGGAVVLDAKFRAYVPDPTPWSGDEDPGVNLPLVDDVNQMHAYRDGIRRGRERPVRAAWLLYVGRAGGPNLPVIAYPEATPEAPFGEGEVGALLLRPGQGQDALAALLRALLPG